MLNENKNEKTYISIKDIVKSLSSDKIFIVQEYYNCNDRIYYDTIKGIEFVNSDDLKFTLECKQKKLNDDTKAISELEKIICLGFNPK